MLASTANFQAAPDSSKVPAKDVLPPASPDHTSDSTHPKSRGWIEPQSCRGFCLMKGKTNAKVRSTGIVEGQALWPDFKVKIKSAALCKCFLQVGALSLRTMNRCFEICRLCLAILSSSIAVSAAQG